MAKKTDSAVAVSAEVEPVAAPVEPVVSERLLAVDDYATRITQPESARVFVKIMKASGTAPQKSAAEWDEEFARFMAS